MKKPNGKYAVIGSGPIRIGQGIEFDYASVHCIRGLRDAGHQAIIINNNPETVSTDFDTSDRLYFEPLALEDVLNVLDVEKPDGVIVQFGGQTAINLARPILEAGWNILGTSPDSIDLAEDREMFEQVLSEMHFARPAGETVTSPDEALLVAERIGYPVLVRPSYVLGGRAMEIIYSNEDLKRYMTYVVDVSPRAPILIDRYVLGKELEVDVICDGEDCLLPGIMEHVERAGVHSGDSMAVYPPQTLSDHTVKQIVETASALALRLKIIGLMNIQYVLDHATSTLQVLEVNPRASRTVPYLSKITGIQMVKVATQIMLGKSLKEQGYTSGLHPIPGSISVKAPVFSFQKLMKVDIGLGPEMKSTGEVMGMDIEYPQALYKAMVASGIGIPRGGSMLITVSDKDKVEAFAIARDFAELGFKIYATIGTAHFLQRQGIKAQVVKKLHEGEGNIVDLIQSGQISLLVNTLSSDRRIESEGARIRRASVEAGVPCLTSLDTARALLIALNSRRSGKSFALHTVDEYLALSS